MKQSEVIIRPIEAGVEILLIESERESNPSHERDVEILACIVKVEGDGLKVGTSRIGWPLIGILVPLSMQLLGRKLFADFEGFLPVPVIVVISVTGDGTISTCLSTVLIGQRDLFPSVSDVSSVTRRRGPREGVFLHLRAGEELPGGVEHGPNLAGGDGV